MTDAEWEAAFAPYADDTYETALAWLGPQEVVLDIGAGDLRFARRAAARVQRVFAIEQRAALVTGARPPNLTVIIGDARQLSFPLGLTTGVLLMRHCRHFGEYVSKLRASGARWLITNARWGMGVERVALNEARAPYHAVQSRWVACACGAVGFAPGPVAAITSASLDEVVEVSQCPHCSSQRGANSLPPRAESTPRKAAGH